LGGNLPFPFFKNPRKEPGLDYLEGGRVLNPSLIWVGKLGLGRLLQKELGGARKGFKRAFNLEPPKRGRN